jgi:hypothetical protein
MFIHVASTNIWLEIYFGILKRDFFLTFLFLIKMAPLGINNLDFGNS